MNLQKLLKALANAAPTKDTRYYLNGIHLVKKDQVDCLEISCGSMLIKMQITPCDEIQVESDTNVILSGISVKNACKYFGDKCKLKLIVSKDKAELSDGARSIDIDLIDGRFPDVERVIKAAVQAKKTSHSTGVDVVVLGKVCKGIDELYKAFDVKNFHISLMEIADGLSPIVFTRTVDDINFNMTALVSPCRM